MGGWSLADQKLVSSRLDVDQPYLASDKPYIRRTLWIMFHWNQTKPHQKLIFSYQTKPKQIIPNHTNHFHWSHIGSTPHICHRRRWRKIWFCGEFSEMIYKLVILVKNDNYEVWLRATKALNRLSHLWILFFQPKFSEGLKFCSLEL